MGSTIAYLNNENHFKYFLPVFRIFLCFHILKKTYLNFKSTSFFFADELVELKSTAYKSFEWLYSQNIFDIPLIIVLIVITCIFFAFGIGKWVTALILFLEFSFYTEATALTGNGGDNYLYFILMYMIFTDSFQHLSLNKNVHKNSGYLISNLACYSIMLHLCIIYFVSAIHKIHSDAWFNGVATYYILNLERYSSPFNHYFSKNAFIVIFSTYFTIAFELLFPFFIWFKKFRNLLLVSGLSMHLGIYFFTMIYDFEMLFMMVYGFFITNNEWQKILIKINKYRLKVTRRFNIKVSKF